MGNSTSCPAQQETVLSAGVNSLTDLATRIRTEHSAVYSSARQILNHALDAGDLLIAAKNMMKHGEWSDWLRQHCDMSERTAQGYMRLARNRALIEAKARATADFTIEGALQKLAKPKAAKKKYNVMPFPDDKKTTPLVAEHHGHSTASRSHEEQPSATKRLSSPKRQPRSEAWASATQIAIQAVEHLIELQGEYADWRENLPDNFEGTATADRLDEIGNLDLHTALQTLQEAEEIDLPQGSGRD